VCDVPCEKQRDASPKFTECCWIPDKLPRILLCVFCSQQCLLQAVWLSAFTDKSRTVFCACLVTCSKRRVHGNRLHFTRNFPKLHKSVKYENNSYISFHLLADICCHRKIFSQKLSTKCAQ